MDFVVGSYPFGGWARDAEAALTIAGVNATVFYAGPRAFQVVVDKSDSERAGEVLSGLGYLTCSTRGASLGGVWDWMPREAVEEQELKEEIERLVGPKIEEMANAQAAMTWSTPEDDIVDKYVDAWYLADFGGEVAVNGDLVKEVPRQPEGYVLVHEGGRVPAVEEMVYLEHVARGVARDESLEKYPKQLVNEITEEVIRAEYGNAQEIPVNVSGEVEIWAKGKKDDQADD